MKKRFLSMFLVLAMVLSMAPTISLPARAEDDDLSGSPNTTGKPWEGIVGSGTEAEPYQISTADDLVNLQKYVNAGNDCEGLYFAIKPIGWQDFEAEDSTITEVPKITLSGEWTPIGKDPDHPFQGTLDGTINNNGTRSWTAYVIEGLSINKPKQDYLGLFGYIGENGKVTNVAVHGVENPATGYDITGRNFVGGIAGYNAGTIDRSYAGIKIGSTPQPGRTDSSQFVGGIVGYNAGKITRTASRSATSPDSDIVRSYAVNGGAYLGGIAGYNVDTIAHCTSDITVGDVGKGQYVGGIVGYNTGTVESSHNNAKVQSGTGTVTDVTGTGVGGIAGASEGGAITNCYNTGDVAASVSDDAYAGGIVGRAVADAAVISCWNVGSISASGGQYVGGILGGTGESGASTVDPGAQASPEAESQTQAETGAGALIDSCYNVGAVTGNTVAGGIAGRMEGGRILNSFSTGSVQGSSAYQIVAQFPGTTVANCYSEYEQGRADPVPASDGMDQTGTAISVRAMTPTQFATGEVTWLLQNPEKVDGEFFNDYTVNQTSFPFGVWGQEVVGGDLPVLGSDQTKTVQLDKDPLPQLIMLPRAQSVSESDEGNIVTLTKELDSDRAPGKPKEEENPEDRFDGKAPVRQVLRVTFETSVENIQATYSDTAIYRYANAGGVLGRGAPMILTDEEERSLTEETHWKKGDSDTLKGYIGTVPDNHALVWELYENGTAKDPQALFDDDDIITADATYLAAWRVGFGGGVESPNEGESLDREVNAILRVTYGDTGTLDDLDELMQYYWDANDGVGSAQKSAAGNFTYSIDQDSLGALADMVTLSGDNNKTLTVHTIPSEGVATGTAVDAGTYYLTLTATEIKEQLDDVTFQTPGDQEQEAEDPAQAIRALAAPSTWVTQGHTTTLTVAVIVSPKAVTPTIQVDSGATTKTYDGTTNVAADLSLSFEEGQLENGDAITATAGSYTYNSANVSTASKITANDITLKGDKAGNYVVEAEVSTEASITKADPTTAMFTVTPPADRTYDGNAKRVTVGFADSYSDPNGARTATYYKITDGQASEQSGEAIDAGAYKVKISVDGQGGNLNATTEPLDGGWTLTIDPAAIGDSDVTLTATSATYTGEDLTQTIKDAVKVTVGGQPLTSGTDYEVTVSNGTGSNAGSLLDGKPVNAGQYTVTVTGKGNYQGEVERTFTVNKATPVPSVTAVESFTYDGSEHELVTASTTGGTLVYWVTNSFSGRPGDSAQYTADIPKGVNAASYYIYYKVQGDDNYTDYPGNSAANPTDVWVTIHRANAEMTEAPTARELYYNGTEQLLINPGKTNVGDGALVYYLWNSESAPEPNVRYNDTIPTGKGAGTYRVWYKMDYSDNYTQDATSGYVDATIKEADITSEAVTVTVPAVTYNGAAQPPAVTVSITVDGTAYPLTKDTDFTVTVAGDTATLTGGQPVNAGTYTVTVAGIGSCTGEVTRTYTIQPKVLRDYMGEKGLIGENGLALDQTTSNEYSGESMRETIRARLSSKMTGALSAGGAGLTEADYTFQIYRGDIEVADPAAEVSEPTDADTYTVIVTGRGNYTGTLHARYVITKKTPTADMFTFSEPSGLVYTGAGHAAELADCITLNAPYQIGDGLYEPRFYLNDAEVTDPTDAGTYTVKVRVNGDGANLSATLPTARLEGGWTFTIAPSTVTAGMFSFSAPTLTYNGQNQVDAVLERVGYAGNYSNPGGVIRLSYEYVTCYRDPQLNGQEVASPTDAGVYKVKANVSQTGQNLLPAAQALEIGTFTIGRASLSNAHVTLSSTGEQYIEGQTYNPTVTSVVLDNMTLTATDYTVDWGEGYQGGYSDRGTYIITIRAAANSNFTGSTTVRFTIADNDISNARVEIEDVPYDGQAWWSRENIGNNRIGTEKKIRLYMLDLDGQEVELEYTKDFTINLARDEAINADTYYIVINAASAGGYYGTVKGSVTNSSSTCKFTITPAPITNAAVSLTTASTDYTGTDLTETITGYVTATLGSFGSLVHDRDFTISVTRQGDTTPLDRVVDAGVYTVMVNGKGNFAGTANTPLTFTVNKANLSAAQVSVPNVNIVYNGTDQTPPVTVTLNGVVLPETDYDVTITANPLAGLGIVGKAIDAGTYAVNVTAKGDNCVGAPDTGATFTISRADLSGATVTLSATSATYTGGSLRPTVTSVTVGGRPLVEGEDYEILWGDDDYIQVGTYTITILRIENSNYVGQRTVTFQITAASTGPSGPSNPGGNTGGGTTGGGSTGGGTTTGGSTTPSTPEEEACPCEGDCEKGDCTCPEGECDCVCGCGGDSDSADCGCEGACTCEGEGEDPGEGEEPGEVDPTVQPEPPKFHFPAKTHGQVRSSNPDPQPGDKVTVWPEVEPGYDVGDVVIRDKDGNPIDFVDNGNGTYSYVEPEGGVTVDVKFVCTHEEYCPVHSFTDAGVNSWYHDGIHFVIDNGLMVGVDDQSFSPNAAASRAMIATILWRIAGEPAAESTANFSDVTAKKWFADAVYWANSAGIVMGYDDGTFLPNAAISREQVAVMFYRFGQAVGMDMTLGQDVDLSGFTDAGSVHSWAKEAMAWCCGAGIINGRTGGILDPRGPASRAEVATMLMRYLEG